MTPRLHAALAALLLLAAPAAAQQAAPVAGEVAYAERCAECHRTPARFMRRYLDMQPAARQRRLDEFLRTHYAEEEAPRTAIIAWLEANHTRR